MTDFRIAVRALRRSPGFTAIAMLTMAAAIGANTAMFSVFDRLILHAVEIPNPGSLVAIWFNNPQRNIQTPSSSIPRYEELRAYAKSFDSIGLSAFDSFTLTGSGNATQLNGLRVSASFLPTLGVSPAHGRNFTPEEDVPNGPNVCIVSHEFWQTQFGGTQDLVGRNIDLNGVPFQVIGIMPPRLTVPFRQTQVFAPRVADVAGLTRVQIDAGATFAQPIARLKAGVSMEQARAELVAFSKGYQERNPARVDAQNVSEPRDFVSTVVSGLEPAMYTLLGAVACVLLIAIANVSSLFLTRLLGRRKEIATRLSLGANRATIIRQCVVESLVFSVTAGLLGIAVAVGALAILQSVVATQLPNTTLSLSWPALLFTAGISTLSAVFVGLFPALQASRPDLVESLKDSARGSSSTRGGRLRQVLIVAEVALSVVLLVGAGLLLITFVRLQGTAPGFTSAGSASAFVSLPPTQYATPVQQSQFYEDVIERLRTQPGVTMAAVTLSPPLSGFSPRTTYAIAGQPLPPLGQRPLVTLNIVSDDYFRMLEIPLKVGRAFEPDDRNTAPRVCVVNETFARRLFGLESPVGRSLRMGRDTLPPVEIVGVVQDVKSAGLNVPVPDEIYVPLRQLPRSGMNVIVKTAGDPSTMQTAIQAAVAAVDKTQAISFFATLDSTVSASLGQQQLLAMLTGIFAALALALALIGLYSVLAYLVTQRTNEIGIRMALGATQGQVVALVMRNGMRLVAIGLAVGLTAAAGTSHLIQQLLFGVTPLSPLVYLSVASAFAVIAAAACVAPSLRASRIDPLRACRAE
jgi:putative ABC transport system permease protein